VSQGHRSITATAGITSGVVSAYAGAQAANTYLVPVLGATLQTAYDSCALAFFGASADLTLFRFRLILDQYGDPAGNHRLLGTFAKTLEGSWTHTLQFDPATLDAGAWYFVQFSGGEGLENDMALFDSAGTVIASANVISFPGAVPTGSDYEVVRVPPGHAGRRLGGLAVLDAKVTTFVANPTTHPDLILLYPFASPNPQNSGIGGDPALTFAGTLATDYEFITPGPWGGAPAGVEFDAELAADPAAVDADFVVRVAFGAELAAAPAVVDADFGVLEQVTFGAELAAAPAAVDAEVTVVVYVDLDLLAGPAVLDADFEVPPPPQVTFGAELAAAAAAVDAEVTVVIYADLDFLASPAVLDADFGIPVSEEVEFDAELVAGPAAVDADFVVRVEFGAELAADPGVLQALFGVEGDLPVAFGAEMLGEDAVLDWTSYLRVSFAGELRGGQERLLAGFPALKASGSGSPPQGAFLLL
jgi:hypothetical protein